MRALALAALLSLALAGCGAENPTADEASELEVTAQDFECRGWDSGARACLARCSRTGARLHFVGSAVAVGGRGGCQDAAARWCFATGKGDRTFHCWGSR